MGWGPWLWNPSPVFTTNYSCHLSLGKLNFKIEKIWVRNYKSRSCSFPGDDIDISVDLAWWRCFFYNLLICIFFYYFAWWGWERWSLQPKCDDRHELLIQQFFQSRLRIDISVWTDIFRKGGNSQVLEDILISAGLKKERYRYSYLHYHDKMSLFLAKISLQSYLQLVWLSGCSWLRGGLVEWGSASQSGSFLIRGLSHNLKFDTFLQPKIFGDR